MNSNNAFGRGLGAPYQGLPPAEIRQREGIGSMKLIVIDESIEYKINKPQLCSNKVTQTNESVYR
jgi:hypothetical protein